MIAERETLRLGKGDSVVLVGVESEYALDVMDSILRLDAHIPDTVLLGPAEWALSGLSPVTSQSMPAHLALQDFFVPRINPGERAEKIQNAKKLGFEALVTIVDPSALVASTARIGRGVYISSGAVVASAAVLHNSVFVNRLASVGHHSLLDEFVSVGPGVSIASKVTIGRGTMLGAGATVAPGVTIGSNCVIAAGAVVHRDVPSNTVMIGNPARIARSHIAGYEGHSV